MKYVSLLFIVFLMWWSWSLSKTPSLVPEETHVGIQDDLRRVITEYIQENIPTAKDLRFERFWTQTVKPDQVKASFSYSFLDNAEATEKVARIGVEGHAILNRTKAADSEFDVWSLDELYVLNNKVSFQEGITIHPDPNASANAEAEGPAATHWNEKPAIPTAEHAEPKKSDSHEAGH